MKLQSIAAASLLITTGLHAGTLSVVSFGDYLVDGNVVTAEILWTSDQLLAGYQFDIVGATITGASGGMTEEAEWLLDHSDFRVLGVDLSNVNAIGPIAKPSTLLVLKMELDPGSTTISFENPVFANPAAITIDVNADDVLTIDINPCLADLNQDGIVDGADMGIFLTAWGTDDPLADFNGDGLVDGEDFGQLLVDWGSC